jgi:hypothetical protein
MRLHKNRLIKQSVFLCDKFFGDETCDRIEVYEKTRNV